MNRTSLVGFFTTFLHGVVAMGVYYYWCARPSPSLLLAVRATLTCDSSRPAYFQSAKATTTIGSAVDFLPVVLVVSPMAMLSGIIISVTQSYKTINFLGWVAMTVGPGLLTLTTATTSTAGWVLMWVLLARFLTQALLG